MRQCAEEDDLERDVDDRSDDHREDDRARDVSLRPRALPGELVGLLEAEQREDDSARRDSREHALGAERAEAVGGREVARVEVDDPQHEDRQQRHPDLPPGRGAVRVRELADAEEVDRGEDRHQDDRRHDPLRGQHARAACAHLHPVLREVVVLAVRDHRQHLDRRNRRCLQPREPAEGRACAATEGVVRETRRAAGDGPHRAKLGMRQREQEDRERADAPRDDGRGPGSDERLLRAEEPAGADDRAGGGPEQADEADLAAEARFSRCGSVRRTAGNRGLRCSRVHRRRCNGAFASSDTAGTEIAPVQ